MSLANRIRACMHGFEPYDARQAENYIVKLDANESPFPLPEPVRIELAEYFAGGGDLNLYPDDHSLTLRETIADHWGLRPENVLAGDGSDGIIDMIARLFVDPGDAVICPEPSFSMYAVSTKIMQGRAIAVRLQPEDDFRYDADMFIRLANEHQAKVLYLCTPNNPTGGILPKEETLRVARECPNTLVAVDEAYGEFGGETVFPASLDFGNVVVLRTFSKAFGLAGIRCGYALAGADTIRLLSRAKPPYNVSSLSQRIAARVLGARNVIQTQVDIITNARDYLASRLSCAGARVFPSQANFVLADLSCIPGILKPPEGKRVEDETGPGLGVKMAGLLAEKRVLVRPFRDPVLKNCLRITAGTRGQADVFMEALEEAVDLLETGVIK
ncbi:MAG TPA: histidinol-phosphate transaminase [Clostridiales bacterium]|nr:histidinol-phosphate transaminase [Clostridiales bacterium]